MSKWKAVLHTRAFASCRMEAMAEGVRALGGEPLFKDPASPEGVRFVCTWGGSFVNAAWRGRWRGLGVPVLMMELGYLRRCAGLDDSGGYSQLGFDHIGWVPWRACPRDRFASLGLPLAEPVQGRGKVLLVLGQVPHDAQHQLGPEALCGWLTERAAAWAAQGWRILYRPHPKHGLTKLNLAHERLDGGTLEEALAQAGHVLTYNSTAGVEALMAGLQVDCHESAHYHGVSCSPLLRDPYLHRLAYAQWNCNELGRGEPLRYLSSQGRLLP